jgi:hypothetical protein
MSDPARLLGEARRELARLVPTLDALMGDLEAATARARPAPDEWAPIEILCHLRDLEQEDFGARVRAVLDGQTTFAPIAPEQWVEARRYREAELAPTLDALRTRRAESLAFLASVSPERLQAAVPLPRLGPLSGLDLLAAWVAHDRLHVRQLAGTLARLWANRWMPLKVEYAGPIPYAARGQAPGLAVPTPAEI